MKKLRKVAKTGHDEGLIGILRDMSMKRDQLEHRGDKKTAELIEGFAKRITDVHNRQAIFNDAMKRALAEVRRKMDQVDAAVTAMGAYVEASVAVPFTFDETHKFEELIDAILSYEK